MVAEWGKMLKGKTIPHKYMCNKINNNTIQPFLSNKFTLHKPM